METTAEYKTSTKLNLISVQMKALFVRTITLLLSKSRCLQKCDWHSGLGRIVAFVVLTIHPIATVCLIVHVLDDGPLYITG